MVIEMLLNNDIQFIFCSNDFKFSKGINVIMYILEKNFKSKLESFHLNQILIKYEFSKFMFFQCLK